MLRKKRTAHLDARREDVAQSGSAMACGNSPSHIGKHSLICFDIFLNILISPDRQRYKLWKMVTF